MDTDMPDRKLKVMVVIPNLSRGGAERVVSVLLKHLSRERNQMSCVFYNTDHRYDIPDDVKVHTLGLPGVEGLIRKIIVFIKRIVKIKEIVVRERPDVMVSFLNTVNLNLILGRLFYKIFRNNMKLIISERTTPSIEIKKNMKKIHGVITAFLIKRIYPLADIILVNSEGVKKDLVEQFNIPVKKIHVIYNPIDIERIAGLSKVEVVENEWFRSDVPTIINVGTLYYAKGQDYLLRAFQLVHSKTDCRLILVGEGEDEAELKELAKELGVSDNVLFLGFQKNPFKYVSRSSVFVLSSRYEGFPNALIEAMACGVPVISTRCKSGPEEIIENKVNGLLVPVENIEDLSNAILEIISDTAFAASMAYAAKETVVSFDVNNIMQDYESLFVSEII